MLKQRWPAVYPDPRDALPVLLGAAKAGRLHDRGEVTLTAEEAATLQRAGYTSILGAGRWPAPEIPLELVRPHPSLALLALCWYGPHAMDPPQPETPRLRSEMTLARRLTWRLGEAWRDDDQRQLLEALARREDGPVPCRRFQNSQHRLGTPRYGSALARLIAAGLVERVKPDRVGCLVLPAEIRHLITDAQIGVRRARSARAKRRGGNRRTSAGGTSHNRGRNNRTSGPLGGENHRRYRPRRPPGRRRFPSAWGRHMSAKRAGQARQRQARAAGICPTEAANAARRARRAERERRRSAAAMSLTYAAPTASAATTWAPSDDWFSAGGAKQVAAALDYGQPIGRRERLRAERYVR